MVAETAETFTDTGGKSTDGDQAQSRAEPRLTRMIITDLAIVFGALSIWAAADAWYAVTGLWLAMIVAMGDAILVGLLLAALFHEWGHYAGAVVSGAKVCRIRTKRASLFRFKFDYDGNDARQFHWMTYGGHIAHWFILLLLMIALPLDNLSRITLVSSVFGFVVFASFIEYHIVKDTLAGMDPAKRLAQLEPKDFQQSMLIGALGGLFAIAGLA